MRKVFENLWGTVLLPEPGLRIPNMFDAAIEGTFRALFVHGEDIAQSDPNFNHVAAALGAMELVVVQDLFLNETAKFAHVFLPGASFLEKDGTFTNAERRINRVRAVMKPRAASTSGRSSARSPRQWAIRCVTTIRARSWTRSHAVTPTFTGVSFAKLDEMGSVQWPCNEEAPDGTPIMHVEAFTRGQWQVRADAVRADRRAQYPPLPVDPDDRAES